MRTRRCWTCFCASARRTSRPSAGDDVPEAARSTLTQMAVCRYNALGAEGLASQSYSGMSEGYMADYAEPLKRALYRFRRVTLL